MLEKQLRESHKIPSYLLIKRPSGTLKELLLKIKHRVFAEAEWWKEQREKPHRYLDPTWGIQQWHSSWGQVGAWKGCPWGEAQMLLNLKVRQVICKSSLNFTQGNVGSQIIPFRLAQFQLNWLHQACQWPDKRQVMTFSGHKCYYI